MLDYLGITKTLAKPSDEMPVCLTFLTSRARVGFSNIEARAQPIQLAFPWKASLRSAVVARIAKSELAATPPHVGPVGMRFSVPDLRASVPAHGKLSQSARHLSRTDEGGWRGACPNMQPSLVPAASKCYVLDVARARGHQTAALNKSGSSIFDSQTANTTHQPLLLLLHALSPCQSAWRGGPFEDEQGPA